MSFLGEMKRQNESHHRGLIHHDDVSTEREKQLCWHQTHRCVRIAAPVHKFWTYTTMYRSASTITPRPTTALTFYRSLKLILEIFSTIFFTIVFMCLHWLKCKWDDLAPLWIETEKNEIVSWIGLFSRNIYPCSICLMNCRERVCIFLPLILKVNGQ